MRSVFGLASLLIFTLSCAGHQKAAKADASRQSNIGKTEYYATATRLGSALHLELFGNRRSTEVMRDFENPALWDVRVIVPKKNIELKKVTNGSVRVERVDVLGGESFDTRLKMSMGFAMPESVKEVWIDIKSPGADLERFYVDVETSNVAAGR